MFCKSDNSNSIPGAQNSNCMLCLSLFPEDKNFSQSVEIEEILSDIFKVLCIYMKWVPPSKFLCNFSNDVFPFCKECRLLVARLYKYDKLLLEIQQQIDTLASQLTAKILESQNDEGNVQQRKPSEISPGKYLPDILNASEKSGYYRRLIRNLYSPSVRLILDPTLLQTDNEREVGDAEDDICYSDETQNSEIINLFPHEHEDDEHISISNASVQERATYIEKEKHDTFGTDRVDGEDELYHISDSKNCPKSYAFSVNDEDAEMAEDVVFVDKNCDSRQEDQPHIDNLDALETESRIEVSNASAENIERPKKKKANSNIGPEPFPSLRDRVTIVGDYQFLLDSKCHFECSKTRFKCISCDVLFKSKDSLKKHLNKCPGNPSEDVIKSYKYFGNIYDEITSGNLRCRRCKYLCQSKNTMVLHMRKFHPWKQTTKTKIEPVYVEVEPNKYLCNQKYPFEFKDEKFICGTCPSDFSTRSEVLLHIQREHIWADFKKKIQFKKISPERFAWTDPFNKTYSFEKVENTYKCNECSFSIPTLRYIKEHVKSIHIDNFRYFSSSICKICGMVFRTISMMKMHLSRHTEDRPVMCELCGKSYKKIEYLRTHKAEKHQNTSEKKHKCEKCGRVFGTLLWLKAHEKSHEFCVCHVCGKNIQLTYLDTHLLTHEKGESKFECKKCFKKFRHINSLYIHSKCHDGAKPYSCDICGMKFTQSYSVTRHKNVAHNPNKVSKTSGKPRMRKRQGAVSSDEEESEESSEENDGQDENSETSSSTE